MIINST